MSQPKVLSRRRFSRFSAFWFLAAGACCVLAGGPALALEPDQIVMIVNKNVPQGEQLAEYYADRRHVPDHHICELDLTPAEEISFTEYETKVVPAVRDFLRANALEHKATCLLTFYGVPIRVAARVNSPEDHAELLELQGQLRDVLDRVGPAVASLERLAAAHDTGPGPAANPPTTGSGHEIDALAVRAEGALRRLAKVVEGTADPRKKQDLDEQIQLAVTPLLGIIDLLERQLAASGGAAQDSPEAAPAIARITEFRAKFSKLEDRRYDAEARKQLRELVSKNLGPFEQGRLLESQVAYFAADNTAAAFDSELALVWWWHYPRSQWITNPLHYRNTHPLSAPVMMTMRLDGPQSGTARDIILASIKAEAEGLKGKICLDSQGIPAADKDGKPSPFGQYDQTIRNLAELIRSKTKLSLTFDDQKEVLPANSVNDVAAYCGWYSVNQYIPACRFNTGAVGFHIASYTMVTLRNEDARGWVRGLLNDGCVATLGPVAEPYLHAFPPADDFFPLLFTGKLTLAEVYWKTTPLASWMISFIGDPLYTPYQKNPAIAVEDLPPRLKAIFASPATRAAQP